MKIVINNQRTIFEDESQNPSLILVSHPVCHLPHMTTLQVNLQADKSSMVMLF